MFLHIFVTLDDYAQVSPLHKCPVGYSKDRILLVAKTEIGTEKDLASLAAAH